MTKCLFQGRSWHIFHFRTSWDYALWGGLPGKGVNIIFRVSFEEHLQFDQRWEKSTVMEVGAAKDTATTGRGKRLPRTCFAHTPLLSALGCSTGGQSTRVTFTPYYFHVTGLLNRRSSSLKNISQLTESSEMKHWMPPTLQSSTKLRWTISVLRNFVQKCYNFFLNQAKYCQNPQGVIADRDLTLGDLIGVLYQFFKKLGIEKLRFKPAYNPYTEPRYYD